MTPHSYSTSRNHGVIPIGREICPSYFPVFEDESFYPDSETYFL